MTTFQSRLAFATDHEAAVFERLYLERFTVERFGQAMLPEPVRDQLRRTSSGLRWLPDLLAMRADVVMLIDAKAAARTDTPNYSIEVAALLAHRALWHIGHDVRVVWHDFRWSHVRELHPDNGIDGSHAGNGSGTPFMLFRRSLSHPWTELVRR